MNEWMNERIMYIPVYSVNWSVNIIMVAVIGITIYRNCRIVHTAIGVQFTKVD